MSFNKQFNNWIFNSYSVSAEGLALLRIFSSLFILFSLVPGNGTAHYVFLSEMPGDFFAPPPGPLLLFDDFPPLAVFQLLHTILIISLLAMLLGYYTKWASVLTGLAILFLQGLLYSIGKVNHEILIPLVPILMAFSNWGAAFSIDAIRRKKQEQAENWPVALLAVFIGFMMFTAGFPKILGGWLDPSTQATQGHLFNQFFVRERSALLAGRAAGFDHVLFWEMLDWATVLFETGFIIAIFRAAWFRIFVGIAVIFHFSTMMTLNIAFLPNFLAYAVFLNWEKIYQTGLERYQKWTGKRGEKSEWRAVYLYFGIAVLILLPLNWLSSQNLVLHQSDLMLHEVVIVTIGFGIVLMLTFKRFLNDHRK